MKTVRYSILLFFMLFNLCCGCHSSVPTSTTNNFSDDKPDKKVEEALKMLGEGMEPILKDIENMGRPTGCMEFTEAVEFLYKDGDRKESIELFNKVIKIAEEHPDMNIYRVAHNYAEKAKELIPLLLEMSNEDKAWEEPENISSLPIDKQISYYIYKLRDIAIWNNDRYFPASVFMAKDMKNAAMKLVEIGKPAVPMLIDLLGDKRPTRSCDSSYSKDVFILRYRDVAKEILGAIYEPLKKKIDDTNLFSIEDSKERQKIIDEIKTYWQEIQEMGKQQTPEK